MYTEKGRIVWRSKEFIPLIKITLKTAGVKDDDVEKLFSFDISKY
jgi:hypothetical protein